MHATRPTLYGTRHAVSAGHYLAAAAGFSVLEAGGNAVDAGCAAGIALGVLLPDLVNVAGVAPILIRMADGTVETIAGLGPWPASIPADLFMREHGGKIPNGVLRTVVPAAPDAWITALERHGTMGFHDVARHAIRHARDGYAVYPLLAENIRTHEADYARWPGNAAIFLPGGRRPEVGEKFIQSDLARTLQYMADEERKAAGKGARRPRRRPCRLLQGRHRPRDRRLHGTRGRLPHHGRPRRLPVADRARGAPRLARA
ncbi:gamma-glutamyltransferase [Paeniroseomonas aquatica]|uniref:gamma-glutamyltransferase n=1 Tax=Paeniroseomonas aquatica TaxID=373043 RepID=UPI00361DCF54